MAGVSQRCVRSWARVITAPVVKVHKICTPSYFSKTLGQTNERTRLKLTEPISAVGWHMPLWLSVLGGTSSTCQRGKPYKRGILGVCEILTRDTKWGKPVHFEKNITAMYKKLTCGAYRTCMESARSSDISIHSFNATGQTLRRAKFNTRGQINVISGHVPVLWSVLNGANGRTKFKLCGPIATISGHVRYGYRW